MLLHALFTSNTTNDSVFLLILCSENNFAQTQGRARWQPLLLGLDVEGKSLVG